MLFSVLAVMKAFENGFHSVDTREPKLYLGLKLAFGFFLRNKVLLDKMMDVKKKITVESF